MNNIFEKEENAKNIYVIRHNLNSLTKPQDVAYYELIIGHFKLNIFVPWQDMNRDPPLFITQYKTVNVHIYELSHKNENYITVGLISDDRFKNYKPIQYDVFHGGNGDVNFSNGKDMPILQLCELIRYLYRLVNLTAFM